MTDSPHATQDRDPRSAVALAAFPMGGERLLVTVATYNEIENLPQLVEAVFQSAPNCDLLVIDDNSPDGTGRWCDEYAARDARLRCLHRSGKLGLGTAIVAGMRYGIDHGYDLVLNMDADFSHDPRKIPALMAGMNPADRAPRDVMIGSRYVSGGGSENWPLKRRLMSRAVNLYARVLLGLSPRDCSGGFRCYRAATLAKINLGEIRSLGYSFQEEILWRLKRVGARFGEAPITFVDRRLGASKINRGEAWGAMRIILALGWRNWTGM